MRGLGKKYAIPRMTLVLAAVVSFLGAIGPSTASATPPQINSFTASPASIQVGETTTVSATISSFDRAYVVSITDTSTGMEIARCWAMFNPCSREVTVPWEENPYPQDLRFTAEVLLDRAPATGGGVPLDVPVESRFFKVDLSFSAPGWNPLGEPTWQAEAVAAPQLYGTPYNLWIKSQSGETMAGCALWVACKERLGPGTYRALVLYEGALLGASGWWTVGATGQPEEASADDLDLVSLAAMFTGPSAVCQGLLFYPGTHFEGSSVSDQYLACETAVAEGRSTLGVLRAVAAAGGGSTVLWYLVEEVTKEQTAPEQTEPSETEPPPPPPIPVGWPSEINADAATLLAQNPQLETEKRARIVAKQCHRLTARAGLPSDECLDLPIFASGDLDVPQATKHDLEALMAVPGWVRLNYNGGVGNGNRGWYAGLPVCKEKSPLIHCDEFPFFSTQQGGGTAEPRPSLKLIDRPQNLSQGNKLGRFYGTCGVNTGSGRPFLNVPMAPGSNIPTLFLCNGHS